MSRKEFTENEERLLAKQKFLILEDERGRQYGSRIVTHLDAEFYLIKNDRGFYLKTEALVGEVAEEDNINKSFGSFTELINWISWEK